MPSRVSLPELSVLRRASRALRLVLELLDRLGHRTPRGVSTDRELSLAGFLRTSGDMAPTFTCGPIGGSHMADGFGSSTLFRGFNPSPKALALLPSGGLSMTMPRAISLSERKAQLRRTVLQRRKDAHGARATDAAAALTVRALTAFQAQELSIAGYWPLGDEIDCRPLLAALKSTGAQVALPVVAGQGQVLIFRIWTPGDALDQGPFGTAHPGIRAPVVVPRVLFVPLIAFDAAGNRLGYGAGYYDRTIATFRKERAITAIGLAYDEQEVDAVPAEAHDQRLDAVMTDRRTLWFNEAAKF